MISSLTFRHAPLYAADICSKDVPRWLLYFRAKGIIYLLPPYFVTRTYIQDQQFSKINKLIYHISFNIPIEIHLFFKSDWLFLQLLCKPNLEYAMPVPAQIWEECARHIGKLVTFSSVPLMN